MSGVRTLLSIALKRGTGKVTEPQDYIIHRKMKVGRLVQETVDSMITQKFTRRKGILYFRDEDGNRTFSIYLSPDLEYLVKQEYEKRRIK